MLAILAFPFYLISLVCSIIVLIDAFKNAVWKGIVGLLCGLYLLYYAFVEFQHPKKTLIICGMLLGSILGAVCGAMGAAQAVATAPR